MSFNAFKLFLKGIFTARVAEWGERALPPLYRLIRMTHRIKMPILKNEIKKRRKKWLK